jgi:hypothetical protein
VPVGSLSPNPLPRPTNRRRSRTYGRRRRRRPRAAGREFEQARRSGRSGKLEIGEPRGGTVLETADTMPAPIGRPASAAGVAPLQWRRLMNLAEIEAALRARLEVLPSCRSSRTPPRPTPRQLRPRRSDRRVLGAPRDPGASGSCSSTWRRTRPCGRSWSGCCGRLTTNTEGHSSL